MNKSADAFRTISEVADWLGVQPHVLRFWESKFSQVKPVKRAGGRRYYRPNDMMLLGGIRKLLHEDGMTIKGVQKLMREEGMAYVADMSPSLDASLDYTDYVAPAEPEPAPQRPVDAEQPDMFDTLEAAAAPTEAPFEEAVIEAASVVAAFPTAEERAQKAVAQEEPVVDGSEPSVLPSFLQSPDAVGPTETDPAPADKPETRAPKVTRTVPPVPLVIAAPDPDESDLTGAPSALSAAFQASTSPDPARRQAAAQLIERLAAHRDALAAARDAAPTASQ